MQNKLYAVQFFSLPDHQLRSQSPSRKAAPVDFPELAGFAELMNFAELAELMEKNP